MLQRVQLLLDNETRKELRRVANQENRSVSDVAREILNRNLKKRDKIRDRGVSFLIQQAKKAVKGPKNAEYDKYAYDI